MARMFGRRLNAPVLDADQMTHDLMEPGSTVWRRIKARFGQRVLGPSGRVDRRELGRITFSHPRKLKDLCRIIHPAVRQRIQSELKRVRRRNPDSAVVLDIPLLIEAGAAYPVDFLVVVSAHLKVTARRLKKRSGWGVKEIKKRRSFQLPLRKKEQLADFVVNNGGSLAATRRQVDALCRQMTKEEKG